MLRSSGYSHPTCPPDVPFLVWSCCFIFWLFFIADNFAWDLRWRTDEMKGRKKGQEMIKRGAEELQILVEERLLGTLCSSGVGVSNGFNLIESSGAGDTSFCFFLSFKSFSGSFSIRK